MVGGRAWEVVLTWGRVPNWGGGVGRQPRAHAQAHAHAFDAFVPPLFFFLQRFFGDFATQSQSRVLPFFAGCFSQPPSSSHGRVLSAQWQKNAIIRHRQLALVSVYVISRRNECLIARARLL